MNRGDTEADAVGGQGVKEPAQVGSRVQAMCRYNGAMIRTLLRTSYLSWFLRTVAWDGLLPVVVIVVPYAVEWLFPNRRGLIEVTGVVLPIAAFFLRIHTGRKQIALNRCSPGVRLFQFCVFCLGIFPLIAIDSLLALSHVMPQGALFQNRTDLIVWTVLIGIYLAAMTVAMYPGPVEDSGSTRRTAHATGARSRSE